MCKSGCLVWCKDTSATVVRMQRDPHKLGIRGVEPTQSGWQQARPLMNTKQVYHFNTCAEASSSSSSASASASVSPQTTSMLSCIYPWENKARCTYGSQDRWLTECINRCKQAHHSPDSNGIESACSFAFKSQDPGSTWLFISAFHLHFAHSIRWMMPAIRSVWAESMCCPFQLHLNGRANQMLGLIPDECSIYACQQQQPYRMHEWRTCTASEESLGRGKHNKWYQKTRCRITRRMRCVFKCFWRHSKWANFTREPSSERCLVDSTCGRSSAISHLPLQKAFATPCQRKPRIIAQIDATMPRSCGTSEVNNINHAAFAAFQQTTLLKKVIKLLSLCVVYSMQSLRLLTTSHLHNLKPVQFDYQNKQTSG